jgi:drug/metabolite transporter (DMT)-like permease
MKWTFATVGSIALVNLAAALFGSNQVLIKITETEISPSTLNFLRFGIAALAFLPIGLKSGAWTKKQLRDTAMELSTYLFVGYTAQVIGLGMTSASRGAVMAEFAVLIVPLWAKLSGQKIPNLVWYCAAIALVGVAMVTSTGADGGFNQGDALCMLSACCFGTHVFRTEQRTATMDNKDLPGLISLELAMLTVLSGVYEVADFGLHNPGGLMAFDPQQTLKHLGELPWPNLALMGMGTTAFTLWIEITALQNISSTLASLIYTTEPLWGAFFAAICLKEKFGGLGYLGAFLIVSSTMYATVKGGITKETKKEKVA